MPRGGHMGLWKPTPKDIFKSRWKRFYKRSYRPRKAGNNVDDFPPHRQADFIEDVPSPWKLNYARSNFGAGRQPLDMRKLAARTYNSNYGDYMRPAFSAREGEPLEAVLRCLDAGRGRHGAGSSGLGRLEVSWMQAPQAAEASSSRDRPPSASQELQDPGFPPHILKIMRHCAEEQERSKVGLLQDQLQTFQVRRLYQLCEEKEIVWDKGLNDPRRIQAGDDGGDRGHFPYIDEQAGLLDELQLKDILRLAHRRKERRHPKWRELQFWYKKWHQQYMRRREMLKDEAKARMGVLKQAVPE
eukprot:TRINITY_DN45223_c0_g1_i1.p1 TRINITY_DN45223_c0_g1~~TRINITY_DN45223_c0_g1_i1.p1  ORF type:complete len:317 (+),score=68.07 TRINITY_DN45223_c0_g1_i1:53-952(+)